MTAPKIMCAKCQKLVDKVEWWEDSCTLLLHIRAHCHGDKDEMSIDLTRMSMDQTEQIQSQVGVAFATDRLEAP